MRFLPLSQSILLLQLILNLQIMILYLHDIQSKQRLLVHLVVLILLELLHLFDILQCGVLFQPY